MALTIKIKAGKYGQVEPNHLSAQRTGQIYAQYPCASTIKVLENGQFLKYDGTTKTANLTGKGEWLLVYNEEKLYDEKLRGHADWVMKAENYTDSEMVPRLFKTNIGDIYTTDTIAGAHTELGVELSVGDVLVVNENGLLEVSEEEATGMAFIVAEETTNPDGTPAVKLQRIQ